MAEESLNIAQELKKLLMVVKRKSTTKCYLTDKDGY